MHQEFVVPNIRERCSTSPMSFEVVKHFSVGKNVTPLEKIANWQILSSSRKQLQNGIVGQ